MTALLPEAAKRVEWYVASRHRHVAAGSRAESWRPYGQAHAKRPGSSSTACGQPALGWLMFWESPFSISDMSACMGCRLEVARRDGAMPPLDGHGPA